jgi:endonuclease-3 related protein
MFNELYNMLYKHYGNLSWWPSESDDETIIGCILTQNTSWKNVEKAIKAMKEAGVDSLSKIKDTNMETLKELIRSSGFYNQKSKYLMNVAIAFTEKYGNIENMKKNDINEIQKFISGLTGIGNETMESIMLYALDYHIFVVDSYTFRFIKRYYGIDMPREEIRNYAEKEFKELEQLKNFHGMIVNLGKDYCRKDPLCINCFLNKSCLYGKSVNS